jgi:ribosome assembly protein 4
MATVLPPPSKRQKREAQRPDIDALPTDFPSVQVQFESADGSVSETLLVPGTSSIADLEMLVNMHIAPSGDEPVPYTFSVNQVNLQRDLYHDLFQPGRHSTEDLIKVLYTPQSIFRVRPVTRCTAELPGHGGSILVASFAPHTSSVCCTGAGDNTARIWDCDTETPQHTLKGHTGWVLSACWEPEGKMVATGSMDTSVRVWDAKTGTEVACLQRHTKPVLSLCWEPLVSNARLATASKDATIKVWHVANKSVDLSLSGHKGAVTSLRWGGNGWLYSASYDMTIKIWQVSPDKTGTNGGNGRLLHTLTGHAARINHLALSTDHILRTSYEPISGKILSLGERKKRWQEAISSAPQKCERLVSSSDDLQTILWQPAINTSAKSGIRLHGHQKVVNHAAFAPDGATLATASFDGSIRLWHGTTGAFMATLRGHVAAVYQVAWSSDSRLLASCSHDTTVKVWQMRDRTLKSDMATSEGEVFALDWSCDGRKVVAGGADKKVRLFSH